VIIDTGGEMKVRGADFLSKGRITPFEGKVFKGKIMKTLLRGEIIYDAEKGILAQAGSGEFLGDRVGDLRFSGNDGGDNEL